MDVSKILVLVLMFVAVVFLVRFEMNSRRNIRLAKEAKPEAGSPEEPAKAS